MITALAQWDKARWPHFTIAEFACKGSGRLLVDPVLLDKLETLRAALGEPLIVTSGYRSPVYNAQVSHTGAVGPHTTGKAVDISIRGADALKLVGSAIQAGFTGVGVSQKGATRFIHLDLMGGPSRPMIWSY